MWLDDLKDYIDDLELGIDVFESSLPASPTNCLVLIEYAGMQPTDYTLQPAVELYMRTTPEDYADNYSIFKKIVSALTEIGNEIGDLPEGMVINDTNFLRIYTPQSGVTSLGDDENGNPLLTQNLYIVLEEE